MNHYLNISPIRTDGQIVGLDVCDVVVSLSCENHVLVINDTLFSDYEEVDNDQGLTDAQCLKIKNGGNY